MNQSSSKPVVRGGLPWWLWGMIALACVAVGIGTVATMMPDDPNDVYEAAMQQFNEGDQEAFDKSITKLRDHDVYADHVAFLDGLAAARAGKDLRALELFESAKDNKSLKPQVLQKIGRSCAATGQYKEAIESFDASIALEPEDADETRMLVAQLYYGVGALHHAEGLLDDVIDAEEKSASALGLRAKIRAELSRYEEAVEDYSRLLETPGDRAAASPELSGDYVRALLLVGDQEKIKNASQEFGPDLTDTALRWELDMAAGYREQVLASILAMEGNPNGSPPTDRIEAQGAYEGGKFIAATKSINVALKRFSRDLRTFELAAKIFEAAEIEKDREIAEQNVEALKELQQNYLAAVGEIGDDIQSAELRLNVARILFEMGKFSDAQRWFGMAALIRPGDRKDAMAGIDSIMNLQSALPPLVPFETEDAQAPDAAEPDAVKSSEAKTEETPPEDGEKSEETAAVEDGTSAAPPKDDSE